MTELKATLLPLSDFRLLEVPTKISPQKMSRHDGVSCDSCMKGNFRGRRFKCLVCYDYDLCSNCFEAGVSTTRHSASHPMQCILTRTDSDLYFGGDSSLSTDHQNSFTCPFCAKMGFTETTLQVNTAKWIKRLKMTLLFSLSETFPYLNFKWI